MNDAVLDVHVLAAYLAPQLAHARVLYVGDLDDAEPLFAHGARLVHVYRQTEPVRALQGAVLVQQLAQGLDVAAGGFDVAIVNGFSTLKERLPLLASLRRAIGVRGVAAVVGACRDEDSEPVADRIRYSELYDACSTLFDHVRMVGRLPFAGTLLCELGQEEAPSISLDTDRAPEQPLQTLLALVSQQPIALEPYAIFQHAPPTAPDAVHGAAKVLDQATAEDLENTLLALAEQSERSEQLELELATAREAWQRAQAQLDELRASEAPRDWRQQVQTAHAERDGARRELSALRVEGEALRAQHLELEGRWIARQKQLEELERRLQQAEARARTQDAEQRSRHHEQGALSQRAEQLGQELERTQRALRDAEHARDELQHTVQQFEQQALRQREQTVAAAQRYEELLREHHDKEGVLDRTFADMVQLRDEHRQLELSFEASQRAQREAQLALTSAREAHERAQREAQLELASAREAHERVQGELQAAREGWQQSRAHQQRAEQVLERAQLSQRAQEQALELAAQREQALQRELQQLAQTLDEAHAQLQSVEPSSLDAGVSDEELDAWDDDYDALELRLRDQAQVLIAAQLRHKQGHRALQELLLAQRWSLPAAEIAPLRAQLDALASEVARRESELQARAWRIEELERTLSHASR